MTHIDDYGRLVFSRVPRTPPEKRPIIRVSEEAYSILADGTIRDSMAGYVIDFEKHPDILVTFEAIMNQIERDKKRKAVPRRTGGTAERIRI